MDRVEALGFKLSHLTPVGTRVRALADREAPESLGCLAAVHPRGPPFLVLRNERHSSLLLSTSLLSSQTLRPWVKAPHLSEPRFSHS